MARLEARVEQRLASAGFTAMGGPLLPPLVADGSVPTAVLATHDDPSAPMAEAWAEGVNDTPQTARAAVLVATAPVWATPHALSTSPPAALSNTVDAVLAAPIGGPAKPAKPERGPTKPRTAYAFYCRETRDGLRTAHPALVPNEITKMQAAAWKELDAAARAPYMAQAAEDVTRYQRECAAAPTVAVTASPAGIVSAAAAPAGDTPRKRGRRSGVGVARWTQEEEANLRAAVAELETAEGGRLMQGQKRKWAACAERLGTARASQTHTSSGA